MTRGGPRKGAGRPRKRGEKMTFPIPVRVTLTELVTIKQAAGVMDLSIGDFVRGCLERECARVFGLAE